MAFDAIVDSVATLEEPQAAEATLEEEVESGDEDLQDLIIAPAGVSKTGCRWTSVQDILEEKRAQLSGSSRMFDLVMEDADPDAIFEEMMRQGPNVDYLRQPRGMYGLCLELFLNANVAVVTSRLARCSQSHSKPQQRAQCHGF